MVEPERPVQKFTRPLPNFPKNPSRSVAPFDDDTCQIPNCPNPPDKECSLCTPHCKIIHKGKHMYMTQIDLDKLIKKYLVLNEWNEKMELK